MAVLLLLDHMERFRCPSQKNNKTKGHMLAGRDSK